MSIPEGSSIVSMPDTGSPYPTILTFLVGRFPKISRQTWIERIDAGKVLTEEGSAVTKDSPYKPNRRLFYFREVENETVIPLEENILFEDGQLLVVCKPHFLPVIPGGPYVRETLINRLKKKTGNSFLSPINRIDRETAGLVLISMNKRTRGSYQRLFMDGLVRKTYEAIVHFQNSGGQTEWTVENRIERGEPWFRMRRCPGEVNARSHIQLIKTKGLQAHLRLFPLSGKKHQLRIHLSGLGFPIINDRYYPELLPKTADDFSQPLQLLSQKIEFSDPITKKQMSFTSSRHLSME